MDHISLKEFSSSRRFGVELEVSNNLTKIQIGLEMAEFEKLYGTNVRHVKVTSGSEGWSQTKENDYWHIKFDRTCGPLGRRWDSGWEIASFIACGINDANHIARAARFLSSRGAQTNLNCGLHIHVETKDFSKMQMGILLARWLKIEHILFSICNPVRSKSVFCRSLRERYYNNPTIIHHHYQDFLPEVLWLQLMPTSLEPHDNPERGFALNTVGFAKAQVDSDWSRNTVELRMPECRLEENYVRNWIKLIVNFVDVAATASAPPDINKVTSVDELLFYLGLTGSNEFVVYDPDLANLKVWLLERISSETKLSIISEAKKRLGSISLK